MLGKLSQIKWTSGGGNNRDLVFIVVIVAFGLILMLKLAPYYEAHEQSIAYNRIQTTPSLPKQLLDQISIPFVGNKPATGFSFARAGRNAGHVDKNRPSVLERTLFDGQAIVLRVQSLNAYTSADTNQPIEVRVLAPAEKKQSDTDFSPAMGAKLIGTASPNLSAKRLYINFNELVAADGRSYPIQGQAVSSENLTTGIEGDYSSGLPSRLAGVALDQAITAVDQIGTAYLFTAIGPTGIGAQELRTAAMETNQQASSNVATEVTKDLRDTQAEMRLPANTVFLARVRANQTGAHP